MTAIQTELDRLLDEANYRAHKAEQRSRLSRGVFNAHRARALADPRTHPLRRRRLTFREEGLTVAQLSDRALVGESTIHDLEAGERGSDQTWARLCRALSCRRGQIDPSYVYVG